MAGYLLHENASVLCLHSGQAQPTMTNQKVKVSGNKIVTLSSPYSISGCTNPTEAGGPCATATWITAATRVKAGGESVLFKDSQATCTPTSTGLNIVSLQNRVNVT
jgi:hypothetical protein